MEQVGKAKSIHSVKLLFFLTILLGTIMFLVMVPRISIPLIIAYVLTLTLRPLRPLVYSRSLKKRSFYIIITLFLLFLFIYPLIELIPKLNNEASNIQYYLPKLEEFLRERYSFLIQKINAKTGIEIKARLVDDLFLWLENNSREMLLYVPTILKSLLEWSFLIPIFMFFFMRDGKNFKKGFLSIVPNNIFEKTYYLFHQFNTKFGDYIFAKAIEATIVGVITTVGLLIIGFPFAFLLGIIAGFTNIVPYIGPVLGFVPALIIALVGGGGEYSTWAMIILYMVANVVDLALVFPILVSKIVNLHPGVVVVSVMVGSQFGGVFGMVLSIPMAALLKLLITELYNGIYPKDISTL